MSGGSQAGLSIPCSLSGLDGPGHSPRGMVVVLGWKEMKGKSVDYLCGRKGWVQGARGRSLMFWAGRRSGSVLPGAPAPLLLLPLVLGRFIGSKTVLHLQPTYRGPPVHQQCCLPLPGLLAFPSDVLLSSLLHPGSCLHVHFSHIQRRDGNLDRILPRSTASLLGP